MRIGELSCRRSLQWLLLLHDVCLQVHGPKPCASLVASASLKGLSGSSSLTSPCGLSYSLIMVQAECLAAGAWSRAAGLLGAVAGSAAGAILSSTRRRACRGAGNHAIWMTFGAAAGIEGTQTSGCATLRILAGYGEPGAGQGRWQSQWQAFVIDLAHCSWNGPCQRPPQQRLFC